MCTNVKVNVIGGWTTGGGGGSNSKSKSLKQVSEHRVLEHLLPLFPRFSCALPPPWYYMVSSDLCIHHTLHTIYHLPATSRERFFQSCSAPVYQK